MTHTVKHGIFIVSLLASIGMLIFGHYAYGAGFEESFGGTVTYQYRPPFFCPGPYGPLVVDPVGQTYSPKGLGEIGAATEQAAGGEVKENSQILGLLSSSPSSSCWLQVGPYRLTIQTTLFTYFGTSKY